VVAIGSLGAGGCNGPPPPLTTELVEDGLPAPVYVTSPPGDPRLFVVERRGTIRILVGDAPLPDLFLDITAKVGPFGEGGLLGLAFPPDFAASGVFYVYYTDRAIPFNSILARFAVDPSDPNRAPAASEEVVLSIPQPFFNHNGGHIAFSPVDGLLYWGLGDGGDAYDPGEHAQDPQDLLGKFLRLDVSGGPGTTYTVPAGNPFTDVSDPEDAVRDEIWSLGWRNPYRWSFDSLTGDLWVGDVGQDDFEEVDFEPAGAGGRNYGWDVMEGNDCPDYNPNPTPVCDDPAFTAPIHDYDRLAGDRTVIGGYRYRGVLPEIQGLYFFGDNASGRIWTLAETPFSVTDRSAELPAAAVAARLVGFGEDAFGELYVVHQGNPNGSNGAVHRIVSSGPDADADGAPDHADNCTLAPNGPKVRDAGGASQRDTDGDGIGNLCDADFDQSGLVNLIDLQTFRSAFFTADPDADFDGNGIVNLVDLARMRALFLQPPGPSAFVPTGP
jgi:hypothetical protein